MPLDIIQEKMPLPSIGGNAVNGILLHALAFSPDTWDNSSVTVNPMG